MRYEQARTKRVPITLRTISQRRQQILVALARYRYLDSKHIFALIGSDNTNAKAPFASCLMPAWSRGCRTTCSAATA